MLIIKKAKPRGVKMGNPTQLNS